MKTKHLRKTLVAMAARGLDLSSIDVLTTKDTNGVLHRRVDAGPWCSQAHGCVYDEVPTGLDQLEGACSNCLPILELTGTGIQLGDALEGAAKLLEALARLEALQRPLTDFGALEAVHQGSWALRSNLQSVSFPVALKDWLVELFHQGSEAVGDLELSREELRAVAVDFFTRERPGHASVLEDQRWTLMAGINDLGFTYSARSALVNQHYGIKGGVLAPAAEALMAALLESRRIRMEPVPAGLRPEVVETIETFLTDRSESGAFLDLTDLVDAAVALSS